MQSADAFGATWRKSSRSNHGDADQVDCIEVAEFADRVAMRDSKDPAGPVLAFTHAAWQAFLGSVRDGEIG